MSDTVLHEVREKVALLTLNRPEKLNALSYELIDTLMERLDEIECDIGQQVVILTGAGDRAFSAGADITNFGPSVRAGKEVALREFVRRGQRMTKRIETFPKPIIAAINGMAHGGGSEIVGAAPLAIASEHAVFSQPEISLGFAPSFGGAVWLPRLIGRKRALRMNLTGEPITASQAHDFGLINDVVPHDRLMDEAFALAGKIAEKSSLAVTACLATVTDGLKASIDEALAIEERLFAQMVPTFDMQEGIAAFIEKRQPKFEGR